MDGFRIAAPAGTIGDFTGRAAVTLALGALIVRKAPGCSR